MSGIRIDHPLPNVQKLLRNWNFQCDSKDQNIPISKICDMENNCHDGSDEGPLCDYNAFYCAKENIHIPIELTCDGKFDCIDGSDEFECCLLFNREKLALSTPK